MIRKNIVFLMLIALLFSGCVSSGKYRVLQDEVDSLNSEIKRLSHDNLKKSKKINDLGQTHKDFVKDLEKEIKKGQVSITQLKDKLTVNIIDKIIFDPGQAKLKKEGQKVILKVGEILKDVKDRQIRVEGHTDNIPIRGKLKKRFASNWELSSARAINVAKYLINSAGVDRTNISVAAYGDTRPIVKNDSKRNRAKNRRIEITLVPQDIDKIIAEEEKKAKAKKAEKKIEVKKAVPVEAEEEYDDDEYEYVDDDEYEYVDDDEYEYVDEDEEYDDDEYEVIEEEEIIEYIEE